MKGKAKELFEQWYLEWASEQYGIISQFYEIPKAFQWGVYQDFADSLGYDVYVCPYYDWTKEANNGLKWYVSKRSDLYISGTGLEDDLEEARNAAIEKFNEIINQNK